MRPRALLLSSALAALPVGTLFVGCSLGLDESKLGVVPGTDASVLPPVDGAPASDTGVPEVAAPDAPGVDAGPGCRVDGDCIAPNACFTARCDVARRACVYDLCKQTAVCTRAACDTSTHTCGAPAPVSYHPSTFKITTGGIGCGGSAARCTAATSSFLFVSTTNGAFAYSVADPGNTSPAPIPITGVPFQPAHVTASGGRVYFTGGLVGAKLQMAWVDVPTSPLAAGLAAHTVLVATSLAAITSVFPAPAGVFVEQADAPKLLPTGRLEAPLSDNATLDTYPNVGAVSGATAVAASGDRLVLYRWTQQGQAFGELFALTPGAATVNAKAGAETNLSADMGPVWGTPAVARFAQGGDGALVWGVPGIEIAAPPIGTRSARVAWVLADQNAQAPSGAAHVDLEAYAPGTVGIGQAVVGPLAWVDSTTVLALAQAPADLSQTSVQVVQKGAGGLVVVPSRRVVLPAVADTLAAVSANGYAFVVAADAPDSATVYVFAPACP